MTILGPFGPFLVAVVAVGLAAPCLACAILERPPAAPVPRPIVGIAATWSAALLAAAVAVLVHDREMGDFGLLLAGAIVLAAGAIWAARAPRRRDDEGRDDDEGGRGRPSGPPPCGDLSGRRTRAQRAPARLRTGRRAPGPTRRSAR